MLTGLENIEKFFRGFEPPSIRRGDLLGCLEYGWQIEATRLGIFEKFSGGGKPPSAASQIQTAPPLGDVLRSGIPYLGQAPSYQSIRVSIVSIV
jgi:hypothetical protein